LYAMTAIPTDAELHNRGNTPGALDPRCLTGRVLCVDKSSSTLRWVVDGKVLQTLDVRFGASTTPTREGVFHVYVKDADHVSRLYGSAMPYSMFFSGGQAVHYSSDFASVGYAGASHGCVNVRDYNGLAHLYSRVQVGDTVVVYWS
jgi:lipoprotein-anchoring transpeptidase ErfK/SrfK